MKGEEGAGLGGFWGKREREGGEAYSVDVQYGDVRRRHEEVLHKRRDQMPGLELSIPPISSRPLKHSHAIKTHKNQRSNDIQPKRCQQRQDDIPKDRVGKHVRSGERTVLFLLDCVCYALDAFERQ